MLPGSVPFELVVARNDRAAVAVTKLGAYPVGFELDLVVLASDEDEDELDPMIMGPMRRPGAHRADAKHDMLRFGIQFSDGSKVTNVNNRRGDMHPGGDGPPSAPVMNTGGGSSGGGDWRQRLWVWPLPPPGPLTFVCEWPAAGIELIRVEVDAQPLIDAAGRAEQIFERTDEAGSASSVRSVSYGSRTSG
jgi:hypothetical protein